MSVRLYCLSEAMANVLRVNEIDEIICNSQMNNASTLHRAPYGSGHFINSILDAFLSSTTVQGSTLNLLLISW